MLSFNSGIQIAKINNTTEPKKIFINYEEKLQPDIDIDKTNILQLINNFDYEKLRKTTKMTSIEYEFLRDNIKDYENFNERFNVLFKKLIVIAKNKLKYELHFENDTKIFPVINQKTHCNYFISGESGTGKTYFAKKLLLSENKREIFYFSPKEDEDMVDKSLKEIYDKPNFNHIIINNINDVNKMPSFKELHSSICVFDDLDTLHQNSRKGNILYKYMLDYRDKILTRGRHFNILTVVLSHSTRNYKETLVPQKECNIHVYFPRNNKFVYDRYFRDHYQFPKNIRNTIIKEGKKSRWLLIKTSFPSYIMTTNYIKLI